MDKPILRSKTVISAILKAIAGVCTSVILILNGEATWQATIPALITTVWSVVDIIIRLETDQPLGRKWL